MRLLAGMFAAVASIAAAGATRDANSCAPGSVTFTADIAPILYEACGACHRPNGPGPFSLLTYPDVMRRARQIADVTATRFMPPWKAEPASGDFIGQRRLTDAEVALIRRWVELGAPEGDRAALPKRPRWTEGWQLGPPDLIVTLPEPYELQAESQDVFRIFAIPLRIPATRFVRGIEFHPGNPRVVHHANIRIDHTPASRQLDAGDPAPGYDGLMPRSAVYPDGHFLGWTPGQLAPLVSSDLAWRLDPGADLVIQLHMQPSGKREIVRPSIGLYFSRKPPARAPSILRLGSQGIDIRVNDPSYTIADSFVLPVDAELHAVQPHAHYRAREVRGLATLPDGSARVLIHITDWDFRWQHVYRYVQPVSLPRGTTLSMRYTYDNSSANPRNPRQPPTRVLWGQRTADEMGDLWFQLVTQNAADRGRLNSQTQRKMASEDAVGYETLLRASPGDAELHDDVALLYLDLGRPADAVTHFEASLRAKPVSAAAHFNLATALTVAGRLDDAVRRYREALAIQPDYARAHNNLGGVLASRSRPGEALVHFREAVRLDATNVQALKNLAWLLATAPASTPSDTAEAVRAAGKAVALTARRDALVLDVLGAAYAASGQFERAVRTAEEALALAPPDSLAGEIRRRRDLYRGGRAYRQPEP